MIHIPLNDITRQCASYEQYITRIETRLIRDLKKAYPHIGPDQEDSAIDMLTDLYAEDSSIRFIFILDEWDFIFHQPYVTETEKKSGGKKLLMKYLILSRIIHFQETA